MRQSLLFTEGGNFLVFPSAKSGKNNKELECLHRTIVPRVFMKLWIKTKERETLSSSSSLGLLTCGKIEAGKARESEAFGNLMVNRECPLERRVQLSTNSESTYSSNGNLLFAFCVRCHVKSMSTNGIPEKIIVRITIGER